MKALASDAAIQAAEIDDRRHSPDRRHSADRRGTRRKKLLKGGRTFWPNGDSSECTVYNLSEEGAHLEICGPAPNVFDLEIENDQWRRPCSVVWRKGKRIGVKFQPPPQLRRAGNSMKKVAGQYAEVCRTMAERSDRSQRETLLNMAEAWETVGRRLRKTPR
jgi:hypothetical protein